MPKNYPVFLHLRNRACVVIGGGEVATHKVLGLLECAAKVTVISPSVTPALRDLAKSGAIIHIHRPYSPGDLRGIFLAIAATNDAEVNRQIAQEAEGARVLLNVVDVSDLGDFFTPAVVQRGQVTIAISTNGASPALARKLREELSTDPALQWADLADLLAKARAELRKKKIKATPERWQQAITAHLLKLVQAGKSDEALREVLTSLTTGATREVAP